MREVFSAELESPALRPVLRNSYCGGWTGKDARRYVCGNDSLPWMGIVLTLVSWLPRLIN